MGDVMDGIIGSLNWRDCEDCKHYRSDEGGCIPVDEHEISTMLRFDADYVFCTYYEEGDRR